MNAGVWAFALSLSLRLVTTVRTVALGRLLTPEDFGLVGVALLVVGFVETVTVTGFDAALIYEKGATRRYLDTAWSIQLIRFVLLGTLLFAGAPLIGTFFESEDSVPLIRLIAVGVALSGLKNIGVIYFVKDLDFRREFTYRIGPVVGNLVFAITLALLLRNATAIAGGILAKRFLDVIASYIAHPYRPRFRVDLERFKKLFRYGRWVLGSTFITYLLLSVDDVVVARVVGITALGFYQMAFSISQLATNEVTKVIARVAFPAYSKLQDRPLHLRDAYLQTVQFVALLTFPATAGLWLVGPNAVETILGSKWLPMLGAFNVLLLWGLLRSLLATTGPLFEGVGRPALNTKLLFAQLVLLLALVYPLSDRWGLVGAAWATVLAATVPDIIALGTAVRIVGGRYADLSRILGFPIMHTAFMVLVVWGMDYAAGSPIGLGWLLVMVAMGIVSYLVAVLLSRRLFAYLPSLIPLPPSDS